MAAFRLDRRTKSCIADLILYMDIIRLETIISTLVALAFRIISDWCGFRYDRIRQLWVDQKDYLFFSRLHKHSIWLASLLQFSPQRSAAPLSGAYLCDFQWTLSEWYILRQIHVRDPLCMGTPLTSVLMMGAHSGGCRCMEANLKTIRFIPMLCDHEFLKDSQVNWTKESDLVN